jgi:hypothetical protein
MELNAKNWTVVRYSLRDNDLHYTGFPPRIFKSESEALAAINKDRSELRFPHEFHYVAVEVSP